MNADTFNQKLVELEQCYRRAGFIEAELHQFGFVTTGTANTRTVSTRKSIKALGTTGATNNRDTIVGWFKANTGPATVDAIVKGTGLNARTVRDNIQKLYKEKVLGRVERGTYALSAH